MLLDGSFTIRKTYKIGDRIKDNSRDFILTERIIKESQSGKTRTVFKFKCDKCGYDCSGGFKGGKYVEETCISPSQISRGDNCACCSNRLVITTINSIFKTNPNLVQFFKDEENSKRFTLFSNQKANFKCPHCGSEKEMIIANFSKRGFSCPLCSARFSLGERIVYYLLKHLNINFIKELSKHDFEWCENFRYDFYISDINSIIEVHGKQHLNGGFSSYGGRTLKVEKDIDKRKFELATNNNISNYTVIDASKSDFDYIKISIVNSELSKLYDLSNIDWDDVYYNVYFNTLVKNVCDIWKDNKLITVDELSNKFCLHKKTITKYLLIGEKLSWCTYSTENRQARYHKNMRDNNKTRESVTPLKCTDNNIYFRTVGICEKKSDEIFGRHIGSSTIRYILKGIKTKPRKINIDFTYISKEEFNNAVDEGFECYGDKFKTID